jgi:cytochrome b subunit of formate dehydrogenase
MRNALIVVLSVLLSLATLVTGGLWWERALSAASFSIGLFIIVILIRRFRRSSPQVPHACHVAAAIAVVFGVSNVITGVGHSVGVVSLALREREYGPLQILRFTTGLCCCTPGQ